MMLEAPGLQSRWIDKNAQDLRKPRDLVVNADELGQTLARVGVWVGHGAFEEAVAGMSGTHVSILLRFLG